MKEFLKYFALTMACGPGAAGLAAVVIYGVLV